MHLDVMMFPLKNLKINRNFKNFVKSQFLKKLLTIIALRPIVLDILYICKELCLDELYLYVLPICLLKKQFYPKKQKIINFQKFREMTTNKKSLLTQRLHAYLILLVLPLLLQTCCSL